jgi:cyclophilin family peptidyl-prolyl cis-trans isomerase
MRDRIAIRAYILALFLLGSASGCGKTESPSPESTTPTSGQAPSPNTSQNGGSPFASQAASNPLYPEVVLNTSLGPITLQLDAQVAPETVENFLVYVQSQFYDGTLFHQVYKNQCIIGGGYSENMIPKTPRKPIRHEANPSSKNLRGTIAMVREPDIINSATSLFLINLVDSPALDFKDNTPEGCGYCVFGQVVDGMSVVESIAAADVRDLDNFPCVPVKPIRIESAKKTK